MRITCHKEGDALYIRLLEGQYQCRVARLTDDIALDFAAGEKLVGVDQNHTHHSWGRRRLRYYEPRPSPFESAHLSEQVEQTDSLAAR